MNEKVSPATFGRLAAGGIAGRQATGCHANAVRLLRESGVCSGSLVLLQAEQARAAETLFWACMAIGAVFVPIDVQWPAYLIERAAGRLEPRVVVADAGHMADLTTVFRHAAAISLDSFHDTTRSKDMSSIATALALEPVDERQPAALLFTSGSTDTPKAVVHSRRGLAHGAVLTLETFGWQPGDRLLNLPELHTMSGLRNALVAAAMGGVEWVPSPVSERSTIFALVELVVAGGFHHLVAGPALIKQLAQVSSRLDPASFAHLKAIYCTGAALNPLAVEQFHTRFGVPIINYYGLTETGGICLSQRIPGWSPADDSLGHAVGCSVRLMIDGIEGDEGELQVRSPQLMTGYLDDPAQTAARFAGDWLKTGDIMRRDHDGNFRLMGRSNLFIKTASTERIHPEEIEAVLERHPAVIEAAICGDSAADGVERLVALVVLEPGHAAPARIDVELARYVADHLGASRRPNQIIFCNVLPRLPGGKLARAALKELL